ncbi:hypothetical protein ACQEVZ_45155 [Dactylosporangium sp. CA-152071]|uniref:hypothetical protein n=1 Tax=Dactylosporangium sp. CA-152071 TaxID=3239933 RepID=UPI003D8D9921
MSESVCVTAAVRIEHSRLRAYLNAPVEPASAWSPAEWAGVTGGQEDRDELPAAIAECDSWLDGDHADVLLDLVQDGLLLRYDEATAALVVEFESRADFRLPTLLWACTVLRGMAACMTDGDRGVVTVTTDWRDDSVVLQLTPGGSDFLAPGARAEVRGWEIDVRADAEDADPDEEPDEIINRLIG